MGKRLERFGEVRIVDDDNDDDDDDDDDEWLLTGLCREDREWILEPQPRRESSTLKNDGVGTCIYLVDFART